MGDLFGSIAAPFREIGRTISSPFSDPLRSALNLTTMGLSESVPALLGSDGPGGLASGIGDFFSGKKQADAAQKIAQSQLDEASRTQKAALGLAAPTDQELRLMSQELEFYQKIHTLNETALNQQVQLAQAINPTVISAANQAYQLMQGGSAASTAPIMAQRQQQRQQLQESLSSQLGPGYATSTAGMQALNQFDQGTQQMQFGMMGSLLNYAGSQNPNMTAQIGQVAQTEGQLNNQMAGQYSNLQTRQTSALLNTNLTQYAGANFVGDLMQGKQQAAMANTIFNTGMNMAGTGLGQAFGLQGTANPNAPGGFNPYQYSGAGAGVRYG